jgi:hypothetical protein
MTDATALAFFQVQFAGVGKNGVELNGLAGFGASVFMFLSDALDR